MADARKQLEDTISNRLLNPKQKKLVNGQYAPFFGMTCVMHLNPKDIESFAVPLFADMSKDTKVTNIIALLPPASYHVTLRGLENMFTSDVAPEHSLFILDRCKGVQKELYGMFQGQRIEMKLVRRMGGKVGGYDMLPSSDPLESLLRAGEQLTISSLLDSKELQRPQPWHMTFGYSLDPTNKAAQAAAYDAIEEHVKRHGGFSKVFEFTAPQICTYRSMEGFDALFPFS